MLYDDVNHYYSILFYYNSYHIYIYTHIRTYQLDVFLLYYYEIPFYVTMFDYFTINNNLTICYMHRNRYVLSFILCMAVTMSTVK